MSLFTTLLGHLQAGVHSLLPTVIPIRHRVDWQAVVQISQNRQSEEVRRHAVMPTLDLLARVVPPLVCDLRPAPRRVLSTEVASQQPVDVLAFLTAV